MKFTRAIGATAFATAIPPRDRIVRSIKIPCPQCGQGPGSRCISAAGIEQNGAHIARRRIALRQGL